MLHPKLAIVITYFNCVEYSKAAVESIQTSYPYYLILVDDFSYDGSKQWARDLEKTNPERIHIFEDQDTVSLGQKWNLAVQKAKDLGCEVALVCNNDILFAPDTIDNLMKRWSKGNVALVSAHNIRGEMSPEAILTFKNLAVHTEAPNPDFSCFLIDILAWEKIGRFPEVYIPCYFEDNHIHTMLNAYGLIAIATTASPYYHYGSVTQNQVPDGLCRGPQFEANRDKFKEIFGATPDQVDLQFVRQKFGIVVNEEVATT